MAYYKVRIEVWCDWNPAESDLEEIVQNTRTGEAICTKQEVADTREDSRTVCKKALVSTSKWLPSSIVRKTSMMMKL